ncbi:hypothetical protein L1049_025413 [Liquidambar formosana]|uniref:F-box domain-containing protein n=1 Tax=Liquidambar formosana TaxID=63359 RepID=A0AAP0NDM0_LIQFO
MDVLWLNLPTSLWWLIFHRLDLLDRLRFRAVCLLFRSIASQTQPLRLSPVLLLLPPTKDSDTGEFFSLADHHTYKTHLPQLRNKWVCGSSFGWVFTIDFKSGEISLLNPITKAQISLPPLPAFTDPPELEGEEFERNDVWFIEKATISKDPSTSSDFIVMVIFTYAWVLAFCKPGDGKWTNLKRVEGPCEDVVYYKDKFYAMTNWGALVTWDLSDVNDPKETVILSENEEPPLRPYLVVSNRGELFRVCRNVERDEKEEGDELRDENYYRTLGFVNFKLDEENKRWVLGCICEQAFFVGHNRGICMWTKEHPEFRERCVYFTDDNAERYFENPYGCNDVGVFNLDDGSVEKFYPNHPFWTNPCIWFTPNPR